MAEGPDVRNCTYVGEIDGEAKVIFALDDLEDIDDYADDLDGILRYMRTQYDRDGRPLWDGLSPVTWRLATDAEYDAFPYDPQHPLCGIDFLTAPRGLEIN